jgi:hypothetical protein
LLSNSLKAPGFNPWSAYKVKTWFQSFVFFKWGNLYRYTVDARARAAGAVALLRECEQTEAAVAAEVQAVLLRGAALVGLCTS